MAELVRGVEFESLLNETMKLRPIGAEDAGAAPDLEESRDPFFDPWRRWKTQRAKDAFEEILLQLKGYEQHFGLRRRRRKPRDEHVWRTAVEAIVADLAYRHLTEPGAKLAVPLSNQVLGRRDRYRSPVLSKVFPHLLAVMAAPEMSWLVVEKGFHNPFGKGRRTTITASQYLLRRIERHGVTVEDFGRDDSDEVIILKEPKASIWDRAGWVDYRDTAETRRFRGEVREINAWLEAADISCERWADPSRVIDTGARRLRRYFNDGSFNKGGRLFGGFWQWLPKETRQPALRISGEPAVTLDYGQSVPRLLYGRAGVEPPPGDLYAIKGLVGADRAGIKTVFNSILFKGGLAKFPRGTRKAFPKAYAFKEVTRLVAAQHPALAPHFGTDIGLELMFRESEILIDVLLQLMEARVVALPIHDAIIVPRSARDLAKATMEAVFRDHAGVEAVVDVTE